MSLARGAVVGKHTSMSFVGFRTSLQRRETSCRTRCRRGPRRPGGAAVAADPLRSTDPSAWTKHVTTWVSTLVAWRWAWARPLDAESAAGNGEDTEANTKGTPPPEKWRPALTVLRSAL